MSSMSEPPLQRDTSGLSFSNQSYMFWCWLHPCCPHPWGQSALPSFPHRPAGKTGTNGRAASTEMSTVGSTASPEGRTASPAGRAWSPEAISTLPLLPSAAASPQRAETRASHPQSCRRLSWAQYIYLLLPLLNLTCSGGGNSIFRIAGY